MSPGSDPCLAEAEMLSSSDSDDSLPLSTHLNNILCLCNIYNRNYPVGLISALDEYKSSLERSSDTSERVRLLLSFVRDVLCDLTGHGQRIRDLVALYEGECDETLQSRIDLSILSEYALCGGVAVSAPASAVVSSADASLSDAQASLLSVPSAALSFSTPGDTHLDPSSEHSARPARRVLVAEQPPELILGIVDPSSLAMPEEGTLSEGFPWEESLSSVRREVFERSLALCEEPALSLSPPTPRLAAAEEALLRSIEEALGRGSTVVEELDAVRSSCEKPDLLPAPSPSPVEAVDRAAPLAPHSEEEEEEDRWSIRLVPVVDASRFSFSSDSLLRLSASSSRLRSPAASTAREHSETDPRSAVASLVLRQEEMEETFSSAPLDEDSGPLSPGLSRGSSRDSVRRSVSLCEASQSPLALEAAASRLEERSGSPVLFSQVASTLSPEMACRSSSPVSLACQAPATLGVVRWALDLPAAPIAAPDAMLAERELLVLNQQFQSENEYLRGVIRENSARYEELRQRISSLPTHLGSPSLSLDEDEDSSVVRDEQAVASPPEVAGQTSRRTFERASAIAPRTHDHRRSSPHCASATVDSGSSPVRLPCASSSSTTPESVHASSPSRWIAPSRPSLSSDREHSDRSSAVFSVFSESLEDRPAPVPRSAFSEVSHRIRENAELRRANEELFFHIVDELNGVNELYASYLEALPSSAPSPLTHSTLPALRLAELSPVRVRGVSALPSMTRTLSLASVDLPVAQRRLTATQPHSLGVPAFVRFLAPRQMHSLSLLSAAPSPRRLERVFFGVSLAGSPRPPPRALREFVVTASVLAERSIAPPPRSLLAVACCSLALGAAETRRASSEGPSSSQRSPLRPLHSLASQDFSPLSSFSSVASLASEDRSHRFVQETSFQDSVSSESTSSPKPPSGLLEAPPTYPEASSPARPLVSPPKPEVDSGTPSATQSAMVALQNRVEALEYVLEENLALAAENAQLMVELNAPPSSPPQASHARSELALASLPALSLSAEDEEAGVSSAPPRALVHFQCFTSLPALTPSSPAVDASLGDLVAVVHVPISLLPRSSGSHAPPVAELIEISPPIDGCTQTVDRLRSRKQQLSVVSEEAVSVQRSPSHASERLRLQRRVEELTAARDALEAAAADRERLLGSLRQSNLQFHRDQKEREESRREAELLAADLSEQRRQREELASELAASVSARRSLELSVARLQSALQRGLRKQQEMELSLESLRAEQEEWVGRERESMERLQSLGELRLAAERESGRHRSENTSLSASLVELRDRLEEETARSAEAGRTQEERLRVARSAETELASASRELQRRNTELEERVVAVETAARAQTAEIARLQSELEASKRCRCALEATETALRSDLGSSEARAIALEERIASLERASAEQQEAAASRLRAMDAECVRLKTRGSELERSNASAHSALLVARSSIREVLLLRPMPEKGEGKEEEDAVPRLAEWAQSILGEASEQRGQIERLVAQSGKLQALLERRSARVAELEREGGAQEAAQRRLGQRMEQLQAELCHERTESALLQLRLSRLQSIVELTCSSLRLENPLAAPLEARVDEESACVALKDALAAALASPTPPSPSPPPDSDVDTASVKRSSAEEEEEEEEEEIVASAEREFLSMFCARLASVLGLEEWSASLDVTPAALDALLQQAGLRREERRRAQRGCHALKHRLAARQSELQEAREALVLLKEELESAGERVSLALGGYKRQLLASEASRTSLDAQLRGVASSLGARALLPDPVEDQVRQLVEENRSLRGSVKRWMEECSAARRAASDSKAESDRFRRKSALYRQRIGEFRSQLEQSESDISLDKEEEKKPDAPRPSVSPAFSPLRPRAPPAEETPSETSLLEQRCRSFEQKYSEAKRALLLETESRIASESRQREAEIRAECQQTELEALRRRADALGGQCDSLRLERESLRAELESRQASYKSLLAQRQREAQRPGEAEAEARQLRTELALRGQEVQRLGRELAARTAELAQLRGAAAARESFPRPPMPGERESGLSDYLFGELHDMSVQFSRFEAGKCLATEEIGSLRAARANVERRLDSGLLLSRSYPPPSQSSTTTRSLGGGDAAIRSDRSESSIRSGADRPDISDVSVIQPVSDFEYSSHSIAHYYESQ